jgi:exopolysaccharide biosynthesis protein
MPSTPSRLRPATLVRLVAAALLLATVLAELATHQAPAGAKSRYTVKTIKLAKGVQLLEVHDSKGPNRIRVIRMDPTVATLDVGDAGPTWPAYSPTSRIAKAHHAVAAINGDFAKRGHPWHPYLEDGMPGTTGFNIGSGFSTQADGKHSYVGRGPIHSVANDLTHGTHLKVGVWNEQIKKSDELAAFTYQGGTAEHAPKGACTARLLPAGDAGWGSGKKTIRRRYHVDGQKCQTDPLTFGSDHHAVILSSKTKSGKAASWLGRLKAGNDVRLEWGIPGRTDVLDQQSGVPLLQRGKVVAPGSCASYYCGLNPRTGIGYLKNGNIVLVTVDGRQHSSKGMTLPQFAGVFQWLGAQWAVNLDGGGSTTSIAKLKGKYKVMNVPSNTHNKQRPIVAAYVVLTGKDPGEPSPLGRSLLGMPGGSSEPDVSVGPAAAQRAQQSAMHDPGSSGGLLDAFGAGG